jgi:hypothetical protein
VEERGLVTKEEVGGMDDSRSEYGCNFFDSRPVFLKADIRFSGVADFMYAAQASWHTSSFMMTVDVVLVFL